MSKRSLESSSSSSSSSILSYDSDFHTGKSEDTKTKIAELLEDDEIWKQNGRKGKRPLSHFKMSRLYKQYYARIRAEADRETLRRRHNKRQKLRIKEGKLPKDYELTDDCYSTASDDSSVGSFSTGATAEEKYDLDEQDGEDFYEDNQYVKYSTFNELREDLREIAPKLGEGIKAALRDQEGEEEEEEKLPPPPVLKRQKADNT